MALRNFFQAPQALPQTVRVWMSTREGGVSLAPYDSLNLGDHVGDDPARVRTNRQRLADALAVRPVFLQQVHGTGVVELDAHTPDGTVADACFTTAQGLACTVMVADCLPVLLWDRQGQWVAAAHAGWRGLAGAQGVGVLESLWQALQARGAQAQHTGVWLGPCIGPEAFEVGEPVLQALGADEPAVATAFRPCAGDRWLADLPALARWRLHRMGLTQVMGNAGQREDCTVSNPRLFFSHRRDALRLGSSGRLAAYIWRV